MTQEQVYNFRDVNGNVIATQYAGFIGPDDYIGKELSGVVVHSYDVYLSPREEREEIFAQTLDRMNPVWYNSLSDDQRAELSTWRQAWLDYPETGVRPADLDWLQQ